MSRLNFAPIGEAFNLGSDQIKDTRAEIEKLKSLISETSLKKTKPLEEDTTKLITYNNKSKSGNDTDTDIDLLKLIQHPKFDDIVKNYIIVKQPEWVKQNFGNFKQPELVKQNFGNFKQNFDNFKQNFGNFKQNFGNGSYSTTFCSNIKNYILFFIFGLLVYLILEKILKK